MTAIAIQPRTRRWFVWHCPLCGHKVETSTEGATAYCWHKGTSHYGKAVRRGAPK